MAQESYDIVIVGGGTAGCILAARLSEDPSRTVALLEAGPDFTSVADCPAPVRDEAALPYDYMAAYDGVPTDRHDHRALVVRGRVLGGSGSVNGMNYARAAPGDYDAWGSPLWSDAALGDVVARIEDDLDVPGRAGGRVPLRRTPRAEWAASHDAFLRAAGELGHEHVDMLLNDRDGAGALARNARDGVRMSMAHCYLNPVRDRPNLTVRGDTTVARVVVAEGRAVGVELLGPGGPTTIHAGEVLLAAGAIGSPHLLTLSGIGPRAVLERLGIGLVCDLPGVGRNLADHALMDVVARLRDGAEDGDARTLAGLRLTSPGALRSGDLFMLMLSGDASPLLAGMGVADAGALHVTILCSLNRGDAVGELEVVSADPAVAPRARFGYLAGERDRAALRHGVREAVALLRSDAYAGLVEEVVAPPAAALATDDALDAWIEATVATLMHSVGTCRMGAPGDPEAVVDERGRVLGVERLRVADISVVPVLPGGPLNPVAMVVAERMADLLVGDHLTD